MGSAPARNNPKRITWENMLILAEMRGFLVNRGPPRDLPRESEKVKIGIFWGILVAMFSQNGNFGKTAGKTFWENSGHPH